MFLSYLLHVAGDPLSLLRLVLSLSGVGSRITKRRLRLPGLLVGSHDSGVDGRDLLHGILGSSLVVVDPLVKV